MRSPALPITLPREHKLEDGKFMGRVRLFKNGVLEQEYDTNERGNRDGVARTDAAAAGAKNPLLRGETMRNGTTVGPARSGHASGTLRRATFHGDDGREQATAEFNAQGQLGDLRCAATALPGAHTRAGHRPSRCSTARVNGPGAGCSNAAPSRAAKRSGTSTASRARPASSPATAAGGCAATAASTTTASRPHHDDRGRMTRERELDEAGQVTRDEAVFEDGSRKALSR